MSERGAVVFHDRTGTQAIAGFLRQGSGPAVVLVHGVGLQASVWEEQISTLSKHYDVIAIDMLGHGGSSLPPSDARLSDYADQLLAVLDHMGLQQAHLVGHSMGALVALEFPFRTPPGLPVSPR